MARALIAAAVIAWGTTQSARADCTALDGTYRFRPVEQSSEMTESLANLAADSRDAHKLTRVEYPGGKGRREGLDSSQTRGRPKVSDVAMAATLTYARGAAKFRFVDGAGAPLATLALDTSRPWTCSGDRLTRSFQRIGGLGDNIRTDRIEEILERNASGALVHRETITTIEGGKGTKVREAHYPATKASPR